MQTIWDDLCFFFKMQEQFEYSLYKANYLHWKISLELKFNHLIQVYVFTKRFNTVFFFPFSFSLANWLRWWGSSYNSDTSYYCGTSRNHRAQTPSCFKYSFPVPRSRLERVIRGRCLFLFFLLTFFCLFINQIFKGYCFTAAEKV